MTNRGLNKKKVEYVTVDNLKKNREYHCLNCISFERIVR